MLCSGGIKGYGTKKEYIEQIETYMNYINENIKNINQNPTIGIIICKENNVFIMKYITNKNILEKEYKLITTVS